MVGDDKQALENTSVCTFAALDTDQNDGQVNRVAAKFLMKLNMCNFSRAIRGVAALLAAIVIAVPAGPVMAESFVRRAAADRSVSAELPENWFYWAHSGNFEALAPLGRAGVVFKAFPVSARSDTLETGSRAIISPYRPPQAFVHDVLAQYRFRSVRVLGWQVDEDAARRCAQLLRRDCEAAEVVARWTSAEGAECVGAFKIVNATPTSGGQWFSIVAGSWGSAMAIAADRPVIERATRSIQANDGIARSFLLDMLVQIRMLAGNRTYNYKLSESQLEALNR